MKLCLVALGDASKVWQVGGHRDQTRTRSLIFYVGCLQMLAVFVSFGNFIISSVFILNLPFEAPRDARIPEWYCLIAFDRIWCLMFDCSWCCSMLFGVARCCLVSFVDKSGDVAISRGVWTNWATGLQSSPCSAKKLSWTWSVYLSTMTLKSHMACWGQKTIHAK